MLAVVSVGLVLLGYVVFNSPDQKWRLSMSTAYVSLGLLTATLLIGPLNVWRGRATPLSDDLRRDVGIWAALVGCAHVVFGSQIHLEGRLWEYFAYAPGAAPRFWPLPLRIDPFGVANHTGLIATLLLLFLLGLSNDWSMRRLGGPRWKRMQQLNYVLMALVAVHGFLYQRAEERERIFVLLFAAVVALAVVVQVAGWQRRRRSRVPRLGEPRVAAISTSSDTQGA